jgi:hypothetical protein
VSVYACSTLVLGVGAALLLLARGEALPPLGACLVLALPLTLCMNRFVFFANEVGATAEAATLFTAIVVFRSESPVLGPVLLALLVGALDGGHWARRAFVRMSYNSGSQALTVLVAAALFGPLVSLTGASVVGQLAAALLTAVAYVAVETAFGVALVVLLGEGFGLAARHQVRTNALAVPLAGFGALIALAVVATGSWWPALALVPTAFVPELALVGSRRIGRRGDLIVVGVLVACASVVLAVDGLTTAPGLGLAAGTTMLGILVAADARPRNGRALLPAAALVLAAGTGAGAASAAPPGVVVACVGAVVVAVLAAPRLGDALWSVPLLVTVTMLVTVVGSLARWTGILTVAGVTATVVAVATWGSLPWSSRVVGPWAARRSRASPLVVLAASSFVCLGAAVWWVVDPTRGAARLALVVAGATLACAAAAVRQWRFAPRARRRDAGWLALGVVPLLAFVLGDSADGHWLVIEAALVTVSIALAVAGACARSVLRGRGAPDELNADEVEGTR